MTATAKITDVERILLVVPMVDRVRREMERANIHRWSESEIIRLTLDDGTVAYGETIQNYTWGRVARHRPRHRSLTLRLYVG